MKLITELFENVQYIAEAKENGEKEHFIEGVFLQANRKNRNGRIYPLNIMEGEVNRYMNEVVKHNRGYGELGHPQGPQINLDRVSHIITELRRDGNNFVGKAKLTDTPMGNIAKGLLKSGANLGVSSRALGSLKMNNEGINIVQDDFMLSTAADIVADPSAPDAYVRGIMESKEWVFVDGKFVEQNIEETQKFIRKASSKNLQEAKILAFQNFLSKIK